MSATQDKRPANKRTIDAAGYHASTACERCIHIGLEEHCVFILRSHITEGKVSKLYKCSKCTKDSKLCRVDRVNVLDEPMAEYGDLKRKYRQSSAVVGSAVPSLPPAGPAQIPTRTAAPATRRHTPFSRTRKRTQPRIRAPASPAPAEDAQTAPTDPVPPAPAPTAAVPTFLVTTEQHATVTLVRKELELENARHVRKMEQLQARLQNAIRNLASDGTATIGRAEDGTNEIAVDPRPVATSIVGGGHAIHIHVHL